MPRSAEYDRLVDMLGFDWVDAEDVILELIPKVQPGPAKREYQETFQRSRAKASGAAPAKGPLPEADQIRSGARRLIHKAIRSAVMSENIARKDVGNVTYLRRNYFTSEEVDAILATRTVQATVPQVESPEPTVTPLNADRLIYLDPMMFDVRTVQHIKVVANRSTVEVTLDNVIDGESLLLQFTSVAADWLSDQLGFQALAARNGKENERKAIIAPKSV